MSSDALNMGTTFTVAQQHPTINAGHAIMVPIHYRDDDLFNAVSKIERTLFRCGVRGISTDAVLRHAIGFLNDPLNLTGLKFNNRMKYVFLRKERDFAEAILKIVFGEADSVARNSSPITLEVVRTELSFCFKTAFREAIVYYKAASLTTHIELLFVVLGSTQVINGQDFGTGT